MAFNITCPYGVRVKRAARVCTNTFLQTEDPSSKTVSWSFRRNRDTPIFVIFFFLNFPFSCSSIFNLRGIVEF
ncbi:hypothetical protein IC582_003042 [Cucumis melo]